MSSKACVFKDHKVTGGTGALRFQPSPPPRPTAMMEGELLGVQIMLTDSGPPCAQLYESRAVT